MHQEVFILLLNVNWGNLSMSYTYRKMGCFKIAINAFKFTRVLPISDMFGNILERIII